VFVVHGRDAGAAEAVARFIERLAMRPLILRELPTSGRTIFQKLLRYSGVSFAVVLLTPDDQGGLRDAAPLSQRYRARQNVIFELGFFVGKLGAARVCALYRDGVELPSDYEGVGYVPFDENGAWQLSLAREMKHAGIEVDLNRILRGQSLRVATRH
jgi:predicted nucleotide-binding protein